MSTNAMPRPSQDYPKAVWESASSLSSSAQSAAIRKVRELGFDENQGEIPLEETLINLSTIRDVLLDTVEKGRLTQLPLRLQSRLFQETNRVGQALVDLGSGKDAIRILENAVEELNATVYQLNLQNQSESILGFDRKMNELKAQEVIVKRSMSRAVRLEKRLDEIDALLGRLLTFEQQAAGAHSQIGDSVTKANVLCETIENFEAQAKASFSTIGEYQNQMSKSAASSKSAAAEIQVMLEESNNDRTDIVDCVAQYATLVADMNSLKVKTGEAVDERLDALDATGKALEEKITDASEIFASSLEEGLTTHLTDSTTKIDALVDGTELQLKTFLKNAKVAEEERAAQSKSQLEDNVELFRTRAQEASDNSQAIVDSHKRDTVSLIDKLKEIENQIDGAILRATGYTLFHSFQKRQEDLKKSARLWAKWLGGCALSSVVASVVFLLCLKYFPTYGPAIYFKASLSLPFIAALTFCGWQYTRERRLEEEYAFKSNISISLKPYQELVDSLVNKDDPEERAKYTAFIISSINKVFTSPTGLVFDTESMPGEEAKDLLKAALDGAKDIIKAKVGS